MPPEWPPSPTTWGDPIWRCSWRKAARRSHHLLNLGYPTALPGLIAATVVAGLEPALVLAIIRQESAFDRGAVSRAGARGLMQLMPATARRVAARAGLPYARARLTEDAAYNLRLGQLYLKDLLAQFGGHYALAIAAYNAARIACAAGCAASARHR